MDVDQCEDADECLGDVSELPLVVLFLDGARVTSIAGPQCTVPTVCKLCLEAFDQMLQATPAENLVELDEPVSRAETDDFFDFYDTDGSGTVDMDELLQMVASFKDVDSGTLNRAKIQEVWDADGDGTVRLSWWAWCTEELVAKGHKRRIPSEVATSNKDKSQAA